MSDVAEDSNDPPEGWFELWNPERVCNSAPYVHHQHIGTFVGRSYELFKQQFGTKADVDNLTVIGSADILKCLIPERTVTVTAGDIVSRRTPKGMALFLSSPCVFIPQRYKKAILAAASQEVFSHHAYRGNESEKVIFSHAQTFTPQQIHYLLRIAGVKKVHFVSFAMKGDLQWAHSILLALQYKMKGQKYRVMMDFAITVPPKFLHWTRENATPCPQHDPSDRSKQFVPLTLVTQESTRKVFGGRTESFTIPLFPDSQFLVDPLSPPLFGGTTFFPKKDDTDIYLGEDVEDDESNEEVYYDSNGRFKYCTNGPLLIRKVVCYSDFSHLQNEHSRNMMRESVPKADNVRKASRIVNSLSKFTEHMIDGGLKTGLRFEATMILPTDVVLKRVGDPKSLIDQYDFVLFELWKAFHIQRVKYVPYSVVCYSMLKGFAFASLADLPETLRIMSGSGSVNQVGHRLLPYQAVYLMNRMAQGDAMTVGTGPITSAGRSRLAKHFGSMFGRQITTNGEGDLQGDDDEDDFIPDEDFSYSNTGRGRTHGCETQALMNERRKDGRLSRVITQPQKSFLSLHATNCGVPTKVAIELLRRQFCPTTTASKDNAFLWLILEQLTYALQVFQEHNTRHNGPSMLWTELQCILQRLCPYDTLTPPIDDLQGQCIHLYGRKINGVFPTAKWTTTHCYNSRDALWQNIWLRFQGKFKAYETRCTFTLGRPSTAAIESAALTDSNEVNHNLLDELRHFVFVYPPKNPEAKKPKYSITLCRYYGVDDEFGTIQQTAGSRYVMGITEDETLLKAAGKITGLTDTNQHWITRDTWKMFLTLKKDPGEFIPQETEINSQEDPWLYRKFQYLLKRCLRIHKVGLGGGDRYVFWASLNLCSSPFIVKDTADQLIVSVAAHILKLEEGHPLRLNWPTLLETCDDDSAVEGCFANVFKKIMEVAIFHEIHDGNHNTGIYCIRFDPNYGSWEFPFSVGRSKKSCARKAWDKIINYEIADWIKVIHTQPSDGPICHSVNEAFLLRSNFTITPSGDDLENDMEELSEELVNRYVDEGIDNENIFNHDHDPQSESTDDSHAHDEEQGENLDDPFDEGEIFNWDPELLVHGLGWHASEEDTEEDNFFNLEEAEEDGAAEEGSGGDQTEEEIDSNGTVIIDDNAPKER